MLTIIRMRVCKSGFQKQGTSQQALKSDLTHLEHLLNDEIKTKSGVVRTQVAIVFSSKDQATGLAAKWLLVCRQLLPYRITEELPSFVRNWRHAPGLQFRTPVSLWCLLNLPHLLLE
jgi:hypothetical protein